MCKLNALIAAAFGNVQTSSRGLEQTVSTPVGIFSDFLLTIILCAILVLTTLVFGRVFILVLACALVLAMLLVFGFLLVLISVR